MYRLTRDQECVSSPAVLILILYIDNADLCTAVDNLLISTCILIVYRLSRVRAFVVVIALIMLYDWHDWFVCLFGMFTTLVWMQRLECKTGVG